MPDRIHNVLFLSEENSSHCLIAETILNQLGLGRFHAYSAGWGEASRPCRITLNYLEKRRLETDGLRSKHWEIFSHENAPSLDAVIFLSEQEIPPPHPSWKGNPLIIYWGLPKPAADGHHAWVEPITTVLTQRISLLVALSFQSMERTSLEHSLNTIGTIGR